MALAYQSQVQLRVSGTVDQTSGTLQRRNGLIARKVFVNESGSLGDDNVADHGQVPAVQSDAEIARADMDGGWGMGDAGDTLTIGR